MSPQELDEAKV